jgi:hypothetical protein
VLRNLGQASESDLQVMDHLGSAMRRNVGANRKPASDKVKSHGKRAPSLQKVRFAVDDAA